MFGIYSERDAEDKPEKNAADEQSPRAAFAAGERRFVLFTVPDEVKRDTDGEENGGEDLPADQLRIRERGFEPGSYGSVERNGLFGVDRESDAREQERDDQIQPGKPEDAARVGA